MITRTLTIIPPVLQTRDVELPETCPHCGQSFIGDDSMIAEVGLVPTSSPCMMEENSLEATDNDADFSGQLVTDYLCRNCDSSLT